MKSTKINILLLFIFTLQQAFSITLPSYSYFDANELYALNNDEIEYSVGTRIKGINIVLSSENSDWGNACVGESMNDKDKCVDCCGRKYEELGDGLTDEEYKRYDVKYDTCMDICKVGYSLGEKEGPVGEVLMLLPFIAVYAVVKYRKNEQE